MLLDDPLSAVDAHVGEALLKDCLLNGPLAGKTRVLVTHALHVLARTDYIYLMDGGKIIEEGTFQVCYAIISFTSEILTSRFAEPHERRQGVLPAC